MSTLKGLLGDDADSKIQNAMNILKGSGISEPAPSGTAGGGSASDTAAQIENDIKTAAPSAAQSSLSPEGLEFVGQLKAMIDRFSDTNDTRSELLKSLRPFMRAQRQQTIDRAVKLLNLSRFAGLLSKK